MAPNKLLQLKISAKAIRDNYKGADCYIDQEDGCHIVLVPSNQNYPIYKIYDVTLDGRSGPVTNIVRQNSLASIVAALREEVTLASRPSLLKELDQIVSEGNYIAVINS